MNQIVFSLPIKDRNWWKRINSAIGFSVFSLPIRDWDLFIAGLHE